MSIAIISKNAERESPLGYHGKMYTKGCVVGMSLRVRSEGERVRGQSQLDMEEKRR